MVSVPYSVVRNRGFSLVEMMAVTAVVGVISAVALGLTARASEALDDTQNQTAALAFIQRERNAHVNRGMENEILIICAATGNGPCAAGGDTLVSYRVPMPVVFPPGPERERERQKLTARVSFLPGEALFVDAFARSVNAGAGPTDTLVSLQQRSTTATILFRQDGAVVPSFDASGAIVVAPRITDLGTRTTPSPTPRAVPDRIPRARQVFLE